jgi:hypothetical protein
VGKGSSHRSHATGRTPVKREDAGMADNSWLSLTGRRQSYAAARAARKASDLSVSHDCQDRCGVVHTSPLGYPEGAHIHPLDVISAPRPAQEESHGTQ